MKNNQLLEQVMVRLKKQFLVPAAFTLKENPEVERFSEVSVFIHNLNTAFFGSMDVLLEKATEETEDIRKVNMISDYLITYFITCIQEEEEEYAALDVMGNLKYLYDVSVKTYHLEVKDEDCTLVRTIAFVYKTTDLSTFVIMMDAQQLKHEYENRLNSIDAPDILVDLKDITHLLETSSYEDAQSYSAALNRDIRVLNEEESNSLLKELETQSFHSSLGLK